MINHSAPDLTRHPPRSPRVRLGGYAHLPRLLDKARASLAGKHGDYNYGCALDKHFFTFTGITPEALLTAVKSGRNDTEMIAWVRENTKRLPSEIVAWSAWLENRGPGTIDMHAWFVQHLTAHAPLRDDLATFFELLDLDDYVTYGGKA